MTDSINNISTSGVSATSGSSATSSSVQFELAKMQLEQAQNAQASVWDTITSIRQSQLEAASYTDCIKLLRNLADYDVDKYGALPLTSEGLDQEIELCQAALDDLQQATSLPDYQERVDSRDKTPVYTTQEGNTSYFFDNKYIKEGSAFAPLRVGDRDTHSCYEISRGIEALSNRLEGLKTMKDVVECSTPSGESVLDACNITMKSNFYTSDIKAYISGIEDSQEKVTANIQQQMVFVQDYMAQYNFLTQGSADALNQATTCFI